jgi:hypothetical protein
MPKVVTSPVEQFPGTVVLADPLTLSQVELIESALEFRPEGDRFFFTVMDRQQLPALLACVQEWHLEHFPEAVTMETFPMSPRKVSHQLIEWLWNELRAVYLGETTVPNAS